MSSTSTPECTPDRMAWSCAGQHIAAHGMDAAEMAALQADDCLAAGDMAGHRQWLDILARVRDLQSARLGETRH